MLLKTVYGFDQYREYLKAFYEFSKANSKGFTIAKFSKSVGLKSGNYLSLVMSGKRNLTNENLHRFAKVIGLSDHETDYFETLVHLNQSTHSGEKAFYIRRLRDLRHSSPASSAYLSINELLKRWYYPSIMVLLDEAPVAASVARIRKAIRLDKTEIEHIIKVLIQEQLVKIENSFYKLNYRHQIFHDRKSISRTHKSFFRDHLVLAQKMLESHYDKGAKFYSHTVTLGEQEFRQAEELVKKLLSDLTTLSDESSRERLVQLNVQLFEIRKT